MNQQQKTEIGQRIRELRTNSAETNRSIADYVGVSPDAVKAWIAGRGISYDNAQKVAELFKVDADYIWRGRPDQTPDVVGALNGDRDPYAEQLDRIEEKLDELLKRTPAEAPAAPAREDDGDLGDGLDELGLDDEDEEPPAEAGGQA